MYPLSSPLNLASVWYCKKWEESRGRRNQFLMVWFGIELVMSKNLKPRPNQCIKEPNPVLECIGLVIRLKN